MKVLKDGRILVNDKYVRMRDQQGSLLVDENNQDLLDKIVRQFPIDFRLGNCPYSPSEREEGTVAKRDQLIVYEAKPDINMENTSIKTKKETQTKKSLKRRRKYKVRPLLKSLEYGKYLVLSEDDEDFPEEEKSTKMFDLGSAVCNRCQKMTGGISEIDNLKTEQYGLFVKRPTKQININY